MRLLHLADVHLGAAFSAFGPLADNRRSAVLDAFRSLPDHAADEAVDAVLVAGDLFDGPEPETALLAAVRDTFRRLVEAGTPVFLVPGNHDAITLRRSPYRDLARSDTVTLHREPPATEPDREPNGLPEEAAVHVLAPPAFAEPVGVLTRAGPLYVYGIGYDAARCPDPIATFRRNGAPGVHVALLHVSVRDAGHWTVAPGSLTTDTSGLDALDADYIALGDHHRFRPPSELGGRPACYPGSFAALDLTETGPRGAAIVDIEPGRDPAIRRLPAGLPTVEGITIDVSTLPDDVAVAEAALARLDPHSVPVLTLTGEPTFPPDPARIRAELVERFTFVCVRDRTRYFASARLDELAEQETVVGHVVRLGRQRIDAARDDPTRAAAEQALRIALRALEADG